MQLQKIQSIVLIFLQLLRRDFYVHFKKCKDHIINFAIIAPLILSVTVGYLQAHILFPHDPAYFTPLMLTGNMFVPMITISYIITSDMIFDLESIQETSYHITLIQPQLIIVKRVIFGTIYTFVSMLPFLLVSKLVLGDYLDTTNTSWPSLVTILFFGSFCSVAYHQLAACIIKSSQITSFWQRVNQVVINFNMLPIPIESVKQYSKTVSYIVYINPMSYFMDGIRHALTGNPAFISVTTSSCVLFATSILLILLSWYAFKKRIDHI